LGNQSSTQSNTNTTQPYAAAQPWINSNIASGQSLQSQYQANPLSLGQISAYGNSLGLTDGFRNQASSLTSQMNNMAQFDRNNPTAKPTQFNFTDAPANTSSTFSTLLSSLPQASQGLLANQVIANATGVQGSGSGSSYVSPGESWYQSTTPEQREQFFRENPMLAAISNYGIQAWQQMNPYNLAKLQEQASPGMASQYLSETMQGSSNSARNSGESGWGSGGGLSLGDSNRAAISAANGYGGGV